MALSQGLHQKLLQKLSPQQIQLMKLLQVPTSNLEERIKEEIEENPALEQGNEEEELSSLELKDEFDSAEEEFEPDGSEDEYDNIDISEYVSDSDDDVADYRTREDPYTNNRARETGNQLSRTAGATAGYAQSRRPSAHHCRADCGQH